MFGQEMMNPVELFAQWLSDAENNEINDPTALSLATCTPDGRPSVRMVLLKEATDDGFVFYTNLGSRKALELIANPNCALCFHWKTLRRQVRVEGVAELVSDAEADAYFASRSRSSRIGAWASKQSQVLGGPLALEKRVAKFTAKFNIGEVPRPEFWSGFRIRPHTFEFWRDQPFRLHDRVVYSRQDNGDDWTTQQLFP